MKPGSLDYLKLTTLFLPAKTSPSDPLAQRAYLAIKLDGALSTIMVDNDTQAAVKSLRDLIVQRVDAALEEALKRPDETVFSTIGAC